MFLPSVIANRVAGRSWVLGLAVFISGVASLIYEVLWIKRAALIFGSATVSLATVLAVFLGGLALGGGIAGGLSARTRNPLGWCALIEIGLGLYGFGHGHLFAWIDTLYGEVYRNASSKYPDLFILRGLLVTLILLPPTLLMGCLLPMVCSQWQGETERTARRIGSLYALNTFGATLGCWFTGFVLLPQFGLLKSGYLAAGLNGLAGAGYLFCNTTRLRLTPKASTRLSENSSTVAKRWPMPWIFMLIGAVAMANEVLWARFFANLIRNTVYTYTLSLSVTLAGIAVGSLWSSRIADRWADHPHPYRYMTHLLCALGFATLVIPLLPSRCWWAIADYGIIPLVVALMPTALLSGMALPLVCRLLGVRDSAYALGRLLAVNSIGCVLGALLASFYLLPYFGLARAFAMTAGLALVAGWLSRLVEGERGYERQGINNISAWLLGVLALSIAAGTAINPPIAAALLTRENVVNALLEGRSATLAVVERDDDRWLLMNQAWQGSASKTHQIMAAHVPMLHQPRVASVLTVGLGVGQTASRFLYYDIERLDVVDIEPCLFSFVCQEFPSEWMKDPRVHLLEEDGRSYVRHSVASYDLISVEVGQMYRPGVDQFYTQEFYQEARGRLAGGGMMVQFVPLQLLPAAEFASVLQTFLSVFPEASLWYNTSELLLMGWRDVRTRLDTDRVAVGLRKPQMYSDLAFHYWGGPQQDVHTLAVLLGGFLATGQELRALAQTAGSTIYTDDRPRLTYAVSEVAIADRQAEANAERITKHLSAMSAGVADPIDQEDLFRQAQAYRAINIADIAAESWLDYAAERQAVGDALSALRALDTALQRNPTSWRALQWKARVLLQAQRHEEAIDYLRRLARLDPDDAFAQHHLSILLEGLSQ